jgi:hypothetical protein
MGIVPSCLRIILSSAWFEGNEISVACACMRIGRACNGPANRDYTETLITHVASI